MVIEPESLDRFIGQERSIKIIQTLVASAKRTGESPGHLVASGPAGHGKSLIASLVAKQLGWSLMDTLASRFHNASEVGKYFGQISSPTVILWDEAHTVKSLEVEEALYPILDKGIVPAASAPGADEVFKGLGLPELRPIPRESGGTKALPPIMLICATTLPSRLSKPLSSRCRVHLEFTSYTANELAAIAKNAATTIDFKISAKVARILGERSRSARNVINNMLFLRDYCAAQGRDAQKNRTSSQPPSSPPSVNAGLKYDEIK